MAFQTPLQGRFKFTTSSGGEEVYKRKYSRWQRVYIYSLTQSLSQNICHCGTEGSSHFFLLTGDLSEKQPELKVNGVPCPLYAPPKVARHTVQNYGSIGATNVDYLVIEKHSGDG